MSLPPESSQKAIRATQETQETLEALRAAARKALELTIRHNPAYLLSALLMLLGMRAIVQPGSNQAGRLPAILAAYGTLQVYEFLLVAIALVVACRLFIWDDGRTLVLVESFFVVGCFIMIDQLAFNPTMRLAAFYLGLLAAAAALARFYLIGRVLVPHMVFPIFVLLITSLLWNAAVPAAQSWMSEDNTALREPFWILGWWSLAAILAGMCWPVLAMQPPFRPEGIPFLRVPCAPLVILGTVLFTTGVHQYALGWVMDTPFYTSDLIPLSTAGGAVGISLLAASRRRVSWPDHLLAAGPAIFCILTLSLGNFRPSAPFWEVVTWKNVETTRLMALLSWPVVWMGLNAGLTLWYAWIRGSPVLVHQAVVTALAVLLFIPMNSPFAPEANPALFAMGLAGYLLACALIYRNPVAWGGFLLILNGLLAHAWPRHPIEGLQIRSALVVSGSAGLSSFLFWFPFRRRLSVWWAHMGAILLLASVMGIQMDSMTQGPVWFPGALSLLVTALLVILARFFGWRFYNALALLAFTTIPLNVVRTAETKLGSAKGWGMVMGSFLALGIGWLLSEWKARCVVPQSMPDNPDRISSEMMR